jgi:hypothetical protein
VFLETTTDDDNLAHSPCRADSEAGGAVVKAALYYDEASNAR